MYIIAAAAKRIVKNGLSTFETWIISKYKRNTVMVTSFERVALGLSDNIPLSWVYQTQG